MILHCDYIHYFYNVNNTSGVETLENPSTLLALNQRTSVLTFRSEAHLSVL